MKLHIITITYRGKRIPFFIDTTTPSRDQLNALAQKAGVPQGATFSWC